ncbi:MAG TPA: hypothetical protein VGW34_06100 [Allosphingosinicella sp.]|nr:hypothetical protein [Allosphingosinicella sp.]
MLLAKACLAVAMAPLLLAGCGGGQAEPAAESAAETGNESRMKEGDADQILKAETLQAVFDGFEIGDLVWARLSAPGREELTALVGNRPGLEHFLAAHRGRPLTLRIETVRTYVEQAGGALETQRIADAQTAETNVDAWWQTLDPADRRAAEQATERMMYPPG